MPEAPAPFSITLDTHAQEAMASFYTERLGFERGHADAPDTMYARTELINRTMNVRIVLRNCLPRPPIGTAPGTLFEITLRVADPEAVADGWRIESRSPEEGPAQTLKLRDPGNYQVVLERE